jgi:1-acyl-sn-glycerol-3-phosphate acyltransferase
LKTIRTTLVSDLISQIWLLFWNFWRVLRFLFMERKQDYNVTSVKMLKFAFKNVSNFSQFFCLQVRSVTTWQLHDRKSRCLRGRRHSSILSSPSGFFSSYFINEFRMSCFFVSSILFWFPQRTHYFWRVLRFLFMERKQDYNVTSVKILK